MHVYCELFTRANYGISLGDINRRKGKENVVWIHNGLYSVTKNNKIRSFAEKWVEVKLMMLSETSQFYKDKC
jgi:hypothetical protein